MNWKDVCKNQCGSIVGITDDADNQIAGLFRTGSPRKSGITVRGKSPAPFFESIGQMSISNLLRPRT